MNLSKYSQGDTFNLEYESERGQGTKSATVTVVGVYGNPDENGFLDVETESGSNWQIRYDGRVSLHTSKFGSRTVGSVEKHHTNK